MLVAENKDKSKEAKKGFKLMTNELPQLATR
jgi:hypothetical protein